MKYPKYNVYEEIYKRFFKRSVNELIDLAKIEKENKVLDICGGNGRLSKELLKYTNNVSYLDQEKDMIPEELSELGIKVYNMPIQNFVQNIPEQYDRVFCQQAINYWLLNIDMEKFSKILKEDGVFVFNTFSNKPTKEPMIKSYQIDGEKYLEISYLIENKVYHIQIRQGYEPHFTVFDWIDEETYHKLLSSYFEIENINDGKTTIYVCRRK